LNRRASAGGAPAGDGDAPGAQSPAYRWKEPVPVPADHVRSLAEALHLPESICELLVRCGQADPDAARRFLRPRLSHLHSPARLPDMDAAVARIEMAIAAGEKVLVHGDYDVDGLTGTALLVRTISDMGGDAHGFVPHRQRDGYDLGDAGLQHAADIGATLIVTTDCGTTAIGPIEQANGSGIDVVVTDHHRPAGTLPAALAVVNPAREDSDYPFAGLAGVGVAFKVASQLACNKGLAEEYVNQHLDLVALGTVADQVPLLDENRLLVRAGLRALTRSRKLGLQALLWATDLAQADRLDASDISYRLGPRINSVGRIGAAEVALDLLLTDQWEEATRIARHMDEVNGRRREADVKLLADALAKLESQYDPADAGGVILWSDDWHPGLIGIGASRIVDRIHRPTILIGFDGDRGRGSGRSIKGFDLHRALEECAEPLERFGGHEMAAGLTVQRSRLPEFVERFTRYSRTALQELRLEPELKIDADLSLEDATPEFARLLEYLGPFGSGNRQPRLRAREVVLDKPRVVGNKGDHLQFRMVDGAGQGLAAIAFGQGARRPELVGGSKWDVVFRLNEDVWRGNRRVRAQVVDFREAARQSP
jgi:single-stranded-DNA-specific exonuclease